ncbi:MAG: hypothetical protein AAFX93_15955 [Verrucomicrobiota bacterium]
MTADVEVTSETPEPKREFWPALPVLLRWLGAITLLSSAFTFILKDWMGTDQLLRYGQFVGFTVLLTGCGWFCITRWKDDKGARTFFGLTAALLPAHFAQLGGMFYANRRGAEEFGGFRQAFSFEQLDSMTLWGTLGGALAILIPLTYFGFSAMARGHAKALTGVYLLANSILLITLRDPNLVAVVGFVMLIGLCWADHKLFAPHSRMRTWDGYAMRTLLFAPFALLVGRNLVLYPDTSNLLFSLIAAMASVLFYLILPHCTKSEGVRSGLRAIAVVPAVGAWYFAAEALVFQGAPLGNWLIPIMILPGCAIATLLSIRMGTLGGGVRRLAAITAIVGALVQLLTVGTATSSLIVLLTSLGVIIGGYSMKDRIYFRTGLVGFGLGLLYHLRYATEIWHSDYLWVSLAAVGVIVILGSSYIERYGRNGVRWTRTLHQKVSEWD